MVWKCPPINLFNWSNFWKWKESMRDNGKGDTPRPFSVSMEVFDKNFDAIFGKNKKYKIEEVDEGVYLLEVTNERCVNDEKDSDKRYDAVNNNEPRTSDSCGK
jgi:hypothetical protein